MQNGGNVNLHFQEFLKLADKLAELDITIQDELKVIMLLWSLPEKYEHFAIAIETRDALPDLAAIKQKIPDEYERRKENNSIDSSGQIAFAIVKKILMCGDPDHYARNCRKPPVKSQDTQLPHVKNEISDKNHSSSWELFTLF